MRISLAVLVATVGISLLALGAHAHADDAPKPAPAAPVDVPGFWTADELRRIDQGLDVLNCTRKDLGFQKRPIDDPFRLPVVNWILDEPLKIGPVAAAWDACVRQPPSDVYVSNLLEHAIGTLGIGHDAPKTVWAPPDLGAFRGPLSEEQLALLNGLVPWTDCLAPAVGAAFGPVKDQTRALLRKILSTQVEKPGEPIDAPDMTDETMLATVPLVDRTAATYAAGNLLHWCERLSIAWKEIPSDRRPKWSGRARIKTKSGDILLYGTGDDVHGPEDDDAVLVIDLGGNDTYTHGASANLLKNRPIQVVIDLAGDDRYLGGNDFSFGGALGGVAIQWDCGGNDTYVAGNCSCGAGILGVGVLVDEGGDDTYRVKDFGEGAGAFGIGLLLDKGGNDLYHADLYGQGFASTWGCGMLVEMSGNDVYDAGGAHLHAPLWRDRFQSLSQGFAIGMRPDASGGVGVLVDVSGNDRYSADIYGQGASYWYSLGLLIDDDGHDTYCLGQYGQGSGIHLSAGMLLDRHGQDSYYDANGVGMGGAHDYSVGFLVDREGDDYYAGGGGAQGGALTNSVAMLLDDAGDDSYAATRDGTQGSATAARNTGGIGLLLDGAGADRYTETTRNDGVWTKDFVGAGLDEPTPADKPSVNAMAAAISADDAAKKVDADGKKDGAWDLDKLWAMVTAWEVGDNTVTMPIAREKFVALGKPALDRAFEHFDANDSLLTRAIQKTLEAFPREQWVGRLLEKTKDSNKLVRKNAVLMVTELKVTEALPRLTEMLTTDQDTTGTVLMAFAAMKTAPPEVAGLLHHAKEPVAVQAAVCLAAAAAESKEQPDLSALIAALGPDYAFPVRLAAQERLTSLGAKACLALACWDDLQTPMAKRAALRVLGGTKDSRAAERIATGFASKDGMIRLSAMLAADELVKSLDAKAGEWLAAKLASARAAETDPLVKRLVPR